MIDRQEIDQITSDQNHVRYGFMNKQNQQLFGVSINMVDAVAFIQDTLDELEKNMITMIDDVQNNLKLFRWIAHK